MAEKYQPILQQVSASPFIAPGVSDTSMATLVSGLGKIGIEAYTGYKEAGLEKAIETDTQGYFTNQHQYEEGKQAGVDASGLSVGIDKFWDQAATEAADVKDLSLLETKFKEKMDTYASAMKQGRMTADQLYARIINTTREHVSRNPWLQRELLKTADDYLEITGLGGYIKTAQKSAKEDRDAAAKFQQERMSRADKRGLQPLSNPNWDNQLNEIEAGLSKLETMKAGLQHTKDMLPEQAAQWLQTEARKVYPAVWTDLQNTIINYTNAKQANGQPIPWEQQKFNIRRDAYQFKGKLRDDIAANHPMLLNDPAVKDFLSHYDKTVDELATSLESAKDGTDALKFAQNRFNIVKANQELRVAGLVDIPSLEAANAVVKNWTDAKKNRYDSQHPENYQREIATLSHLFAGTTSSLVATNGAEAIAGIVDAGTNTPMPTELGKAITTMAAVIKDSKSFPTLKAKIDTTAKVVGQMANVAAKDQFASMSPTDRATATTVVAEYMDSAKGLVDKHIKNLAEEGVKIGWGQLADGSITLQYEEGSARNDAELKKLNAIYPEHMNNAIKAYSHLAGRTDYGRVFKDYFLGGAPDLQVEKPIAYNPNPSEKVMAGKVADLTPEVPNQASIAELEKEIAKATSPAIKAILVNEYNRIKEAVTNPQPIPPKMNKGAKGKITPSATPIAGGAPYGLRPDGTPKGEGFLGKLKVPGTNDVATEYSVGVNINGKEMDIPMLTPNLTPREITKVLEAARDGTFPSQEIINKATAHAKKRISKGLSPFAQKGE